MYFAMAVVPYTYPPNNKVYGPGASLSLGLVPQFVAAIPRGTGANERIGNQVHITRCLVTGYVRNNPVNSAVRVALVLDRQPNRTALTASTQFYSSLQAYAQPDPDTFDRFVLLREQLFTFDNPTLNAAIPFVWDVPLGYTATTNNTASGSISSWTTNALYVFAQANDITTNAAATPSGVVGFTVFFEDR